MSKIKTALILSGFFIFFSFYSTVFATNINPSSSIKNSQNFWQSNNFWFGSRWFLENGYSITSNFCRMAQKFIPKESYNLDKIHLRINRDSDNSISNLLVEIREHSPKGSVIAISDSINASAVPLYGPGDLFFQFNAGRLEADTVYYWIVKTDMEFNLSSSSLSKFWIGTGENSDVPSADAQRSPDCVDTWLTLNSQGYTAFYYEIYAKEKSSLILVPGILGSWTDDFTKPFRHSEPISQSEWKLTEESDSKTLKELNKLGYLPHTWQDLKTNLPGYGYNFYKCPYDWRLKNQDIARNYLIPCIDKAKSETGASKVNIIAHSMGGLVTRTYIQDDLLYRDDIDKFIMLGTPNHGSAKAYYLWEGGELTHGWFGLLGTVTEKAVMGRLFKLGIHKTRQAELNYVHNFFPSVQQLLPTVDYLEMLFAGFRDVSTQTWQNSFLQSLNDDFIDLRTKVNAQVFATEGHETLENIMVFFPNVDNPLSDPGFFYPDGLPIPLFESDTTFGDGTVLSEKSAKIDGLGYQVKSAILDPADFLIHTNLPNAFLNEILSFLDYQNTEVLGPFYHPTFPKEILVISNDSPQSRLQVEDPEGRKLGLDPVTGQETEELPEGIYSGKDESGIELGIIINPVPGKYEVSIYAPEQSEFETGITYTQDECPITANQDNSGLATTGQVQTFTIDLSKDCQEEAVSYSLNAKVEIKPDSFKLLGKERHITAYIQLPQPYQVEDIDPDTVRLNNTVAGLKYKFINRDKLEKPSEDESNTLKVKFAKNKVSDILTPGDNQLTVSGNLKDGTKFAGGAAVTLK